MARFFGTIFKRLSGTANERPDLLDVARKMLGQLEDQRRMSGVATTAMTRHLPDGSTVRVGFNGSIPIVQITSGSPGAEEKEELCEFYMESGILDLGPNIAADVLDPPTVADQAPAFRFSGEASCSATPTQGRLLVSKKGGKYSVKGECLARIDPEPTPRACDPVPAEEGDDPAWDNTREEKLLAQARLQASLWTGLMAKWVQAQYGTPDAKYRDVGAPTSSLEVPAWSAPDELGEVKLNSTLQLDYRWGSTWLLIDPDRTYNYWFVNASASSLTFHRAVSRNSCTELLKGALGKAPDPELRGRMEYYLLAQLSPVAEPEFEIEFDEPVTGSPFAYGWHANARGSEIAVVVYNKPAFQTQLLRKQITRTEEGFELLEITDDPLPYLNNWREHFPGGMLVPSADNRTMRLAGNRFQPDEFNAPLSSSLVWDAPVYGYYLPDGTLEVVMSKFVSSDAFQGDTLCFQNFWPKVGIVDEAPCTYSDGRELVTVARGYYTERYSSVRIDTMEKETSGLSPAQANYALRYMDNVQRNASFGTWTHTFDDSIYSITINCPSANFNDPPTKTGTANLSNPPPSASCFVYNTTELTTTDGQCTVTTAGTQTELAKPFYTGSDCEVVPDYDVTESWLSTYTVEAETVTVTYDAYSFSQHIERGSPTLLIIPAGSATGVFLREYDGYFNRLTVVQRLGLSIGGLTGRLQISGGAVLTCSYSLSEPPHTPGATVEQEWTLNLGSWGTYQYINLAAPASFSVSGGSAGSMTSGTETIRVRWLGVNAVPDEPIQEVEGTVYTLTGGGIVPGAPTPTCGDLNLEDPAGGVNNPILSYGFGATANVDWIDEITGQYGFWSDYPIEVRVSSEGKELLHQNLVYMQATFPDIERDSITGYQNFTNIPSFIGAV